MSKLVVAFDVDDTLIVPAVATGFERDVPNYETIAVYRWFQAQGHTMVIWSGGGADYAAQWADKLGLKADFYMDKHDAHHDAGINGVVAADLAFDDSSYLDLGKVNIHVKRVNNGVVRHPERIEHAAEVRSADLNSSDHKSDNSAPTGNSGYPCRSCSVEPFVTREGREIHENLKHDVVRGPTNSDTANALIEATRFPVPDSGKHSPGHVFSSSLGFTCLCDSCSAARTFSVLEDK